MLKKHHSTIKVYGFSLIEVSVVILIVGIFIAGVISTQNLIKKSRISAAKSLTLSSPITGIRDSALWLETSIDSNFKDGESENGHSISSWGDSHNAVNKVSISAVGNGPVYSNTINSIHAVRFDGSSSNYLQIDDASFLNKTDYTIFILEQRDQSTDSIGNTNYLIGDSSISTANQSLLLGYSGDQQVIHSQGGTNSYTALTSGYLDSKNKPRIFTFVSDSVLGKQIYINGILAAQSSDTTQLSNLSSLAIGKNYAGQIGEVAIFTRALKAEERSAVEDYAGKKWTTKINRNSASSGSCIGYTVTDNGCDMSLATCAINQSGVSATVSPTTSSISLPCNATHYAGSVNYTCINGTANVTGSCSCATGYKGVGCSTCDDTANYVSNGSGGCQLALGCTITATGVTGSLSVAHNATGPLTCNAANYSGSVSYSCSNGTPTITGTCQETCTINVTGVVNRVVNKVATTTTVACDSGYTGNYSYTCGSSGSYTTVTNSCSHTPTTIYLTSGTSWTVPSDWISSANSIEVIGGGGGGASYLNSSGGGGGGGAYAKITNLTLTAGATISYSIGSGGNGGNNGTAGTNGGDTWFNGTTLASSSVGAKGGVGGSTTSAGAGGSTGSSIGSIKYAGGNGGTGGNYGGAGGGGAAGPNGNGAAGGNNGFNTGAGGGGGGGGTAGSAGAGSGSISGTGGLGANSSGTVAGTAGANVNSGTASGGNGSSASNSSGGGGGGGGGVGNPPGSGGAGGAGREWDSTHGSGGGGGGAGDQPGGAASSAKGGNGGLYGGGGGGSGADTNNLGGNGAQGIIVIKY